MATKLKNLKIKKVDFVDNGANPGASIARPRRKFPRAQRFPLSATPWHAAVLAGPRTKFGNIATR